MSAVDTQDLPLFDVNKRSLFLTLLHYINFNQI